jgi:hypothetical protein
MAAAGRRREARAASAPTRANAALAETPAPNVVQRVFGYADNAPRHEPGCDPAKAGLGAISLACEEVSGRLRTGP